MADDVRANIDITTSNAESNVEGLEGKVRDLDQAIDTADGQTVTVPVEAPGATETATKLDGVDAAARRAGAGATVGAQAISDLTGPLGDASGAASTMGQSVEGLSQLIGPLAAKMGVSAESVATLTTGLGIAAVAVAAGAALWSVFRDNQDKAREATKKMTEVQQDFADGKFEEAAQKLADKYGSLFDRANDAGISTDTLTRALLGNKQATDDVNTALSGTTRMFSELPTDAEQLATDVGNASKAFQDAGEKMDTAQQRGHDVAGAMADIAAAAGPAGTTVDDLADSFDHLKDSLKLESSVLDVGAAFDDVQTAARDAAAAAKTGGQDSEDAQRGVQRSVLDLKQNVIDYATEVGNLPADKVTAILALIDKGKIAEAEAAFNALATPIHVPVIVDYHVDDSREAHRAKSLETSQPLVTNVTNVYQPPITPLAVQAAQQRTAQTQSGYYPI